MINGKSKRLAASTSYPSNQSVMQSTWGIRATAKVQRAISKVALFSVGSFEGRKRPQLPLHYQSLNFLWKIIHEVFGQTKGKKKFHPFFFHPPKKVDFFECIFFSVSWCGIDFSVAFALAADWPSPRLRGEVSSPFSPLATSRNFGNKNPSKSAKLQFLHLFGLAKNDVNILCKMMG